MAGAKHDGEEFVIEQLTNALFTNLVMFKGEKSHTAFTCIHDELKPMQNAKKICFHIYASWAS